MATKIYQHSLHDIEEKLRNYLWNHLQVHSNEIPEGGPQHISFQDCPGSEPLQKHYLQEWPTKPELTLGMLAYNVALPKQFAHLVENLLANISYLAINSPWCYYDSDYCYTRNEQRGILAPLLAQKYVRYGVRTSEEKVIENIGKDIWQIEKREFHFLAKIKLSFSYDRQHRLSLLARSPSQQETLLRHFLQYSFSSINYDKEGEVSYLSAIRSNAQGLTKNIIFMASTFFGVSAEKLSPLIVYEWCTSSEADHLLREFFAACVWGYYHKKGRRKFLALAPPHPQLSKKMAHFHPQPELRDLYLEDLVSWAREIYNMHK